MSLSDNQISALRGVSDAIRGDMPPKVRAAYEVILNTIIAELGESPQAWRGAEVLGTHVIESFKRTLGIDPDEATEMEARLIQVSALALVLVVADLLTSPWAQLAREGES